MALKIGDNFNYQGQKPNFERDSFATLAAMKAYPETSIDDGHLSYCKEDGKRYEFKTSNTIDETTGKWREFKPASGDESSKPYIIDYLSNDGNGTITKEQYNEILNAINNKTQIMIINGGYTYYCTLAINTSNEIILEIVNFYLFIIIVIATNYSFQIDKMESIISPDEGIAGQFLKKTARGVEWANDRDTIYNKATQQADGLMSKEDKAKLDGLTGASLKILTQEEYDATEPKAEDTVYFIKG